jgi:hypothetical protein
LRDFCPSFNTRPPDGLKPGRVAMLETHRVQFGVMDTVGLRVPQGPRSRVNAVIGHWLEDESDEEIATALRELS